LRQQPAVPEKLPLALVPEPVVALGDPAVPGAGFGLVTVEFSAVLPVAEPSGATWLVPAVGPHGRPRASVRPVLSVPAVDGLVCIVPETDGLVPVEPDADAFGLVGDVVAPEPLMPAEPLLVPEDAPALPAAPLLAPPPPWASANPVLPARRIAAIIDSECRVRRIG
jgi:hypothetical protein